MQQKNAIKPRCNYKFLRHGKVTADFANQMLPDKRTIIMVVCFFPVSIYDLLELIDGYTACKMCMLLGLKIPAT